MPNNTKNFYKSFIPLKIRHAALPRVLRLYKEPNTRIKIRPQPFLTCKTTYLLSIKMSKKNSAIAQNIRYGAHKTGLPCITDSEKSWNLCRQD